MNINKMTFRSQIIIFIFSLLSYSSVYAQKTDTIVHINGNILTGEFKKLTSGVVSYKMQGMGTVSIDEYAINTIKSNKLFEVKMKSGYMYWGKLDTSAQYKKVNIVYGDSRILLALDQIVEIYPIKRNFWRRLNGHFNLGFEFIKSSNIGSLNISGDLNYRKKKTNFMLKWDEHIVANTDSITSSKSDVHFSYEAHLRGLWSLGFTIGASENLELRTRLRVYTSATIIRDLVYTNIQRLWLGVGFYGGPEWKLGETNYTKATNGIFSLNWSIYKLSGSTFKLTSNIDYLPYISENSRYRVSINIHPYIEIVNNFYIGLKYYYDFDSNTDTKGTLKDDFGINLTVSYSFH